MHGCILNLKKENSYEIVTTFCEINMFIFRYPECVERDFTKPKRSREAED